MISIPSDWARKFGIRKGDELEIIEEERRFFVSTQKELTKKSTEINIDNLEPMVLRTIASLYKAGYDEVKVTFSDPEQVMQVQNSLKNEIAGFEIVEQGKTYCIIKNIEGPLEEGFEPILRRTFILLLTMAEESLEAIRKQDYADLQRLRFIEDSNNRFTTFCRRALSKKGYKDQAKIQFIYHIIDQLEKIADQYKYLFDYLMKEENAKHKLSAETLSYFQNTNKMLRNYYELFYNFDKAKVAEIGKLRKKLVQNVGSMLENAGRKDAVVLHYLVLQVQEIFELVEPYLAMVL